MATKPTPSDYTGLVLFLRALSFIMTVVFLILNAWFLSYMDRLTPESCACALSWHRTVLQGIFVLLIINGVVALFFGRASIFIAIPVLLLFVVYVIVAAMYVHRINKTKCTCAQTRAFTVLKWVNIWNIVVLSLFALKLLQVIVMIVAINKSMKGKRKD